jgi:hypothetical protein
MVLLKNFTLKILLSLKNDNSNIELFFKDNNILVYSAAKLNVKNIFSRINLFSTTEINQLISIFP